MKIDRAVFEKILWTKSLRKKIIIEKKKQKNYNKVLETEDPNNNKQYNHYKVFRLKRKTLITITNHLELNNKRL